MIPDWDTNNLFISDLLPSKEPELVALLRSQLESSRLKTIAGSRDIWCRDYMPLQLGPNEFCQLRYRPDYLRGYEHLITPPEVGHLAFMENYRLDSIILDGGNVVASSTKVILTGKVFRENKRMARNVLRRRLASLFQADCIFIPQEPGDPIGHADGMVRFVAEDHVVMNDYSAIAPAFGNRLRKQLEREGLVVDTFPMVEEPPGNKSAIPSAVGLYINYLRVGNAIVLPAYGRPEDDAALQKLRVILPQAAITQVCCRSLAEQGGALNCVSWTIKQV